MKWLLGDNVKTKYEPNIEFLSPLPIIECVNALEKLCADSYQSSNLIHVSIERLDEMTLGFTLRKTYWSKEILGKPNFWGDYSKRTQIRYEVIKATGTLSQHLDRSTQVICRAYVAKQTYIPYVALLLVPLTVIALAVIYIFFSIIAVIVGMAIFVFAVSKFLDFKSSFDADCGRLSNLVKQTLNG